MDIYKELASEVFRKPCCEITEDERTSVKRAFYKYLYTPYPEELEDATLS